MIREKIKEPDDIEDECGFAIPLTALKNNHHRSYHRANCPRIKGKKVVRFTNADEVNHVFPDTMRVYPCHMCQPEPLPQLKRNHGFNLLEYLKRFNSE